MTHDLRRLRLHGLIERVLHTNRHVMANEGIGFAVFGAKLDKRLLRPLLEANVPPVPTELRQALRTIERAISDYVTSARRGLAA
jgi:hypothetical protein